jgi:hypothetical protein
MPLFTPCQHPWQVTSSHNPGGQKKDVVSVPNRVFSVQIRISGLLPNARKMCILAAITSTITEAEGHAQKELDPYRR